MKLVKQSFGIQSNADTEDKQNSHLIERKEVENTPFNIITQNGVSFATLGNYRLTEYKETPEEAEEEIKHITWNRLIQVTAILVEKLKDKEYNQLNAE